MKKTQKNTIKKGLYIGKIIQDSLNSSSYDEVLNKVSKRLQAQKRSFLVTPNPEFLVYASENPWFSNILDKADMVIPDGVAFFWAQEVLKGKNILSRLGIGLKVGLKVIFRGWGKKRITGTDLVELLCKQAAQTGKTVYFLGGRPIKGKKVGEIALRKLQNKYSGLKGWVDEAFELDLKEINSRNNKVKQLVARINQKKPDFLFVALNMGKQEKFIWENWSKLDVKLAVGIGGAFDYLSGMVKRAPLWLRNAGFEWLYRLIKQPWRFSRQLSLLKFIFWVIKGE